MKNMSHWAAQLKDALSNITRQRSLVSDLSNTKLVNLPAQMENKYDSK